MDTPLATFTGERANEGLGRPRSISHGLAVSAAMQDLEATIV